MSTTGRSVDLARLGEQRLDLKQARVSEKAEVGGDHPDLAHGEVEVDDDGTARLEAGKLDLPETVDDALADEDEVAVPAVAAVAVADPDRDETGVALDRREVEETGTVAEALVRLLDGDDVGSDLGDHRSDARRIEAPVGADALVDVVGGEDRPPALAVRHRPSAADRARP